MIQYGVKMRIPRRTDSELQIFEEKNTISILLYLDQVGKGRKVDIYGAISTNPRMPKKLLMLEDAGLIYRTVGSCFRCEYYTLTDRGQRIIDGLKEVERILREGNTAEERTAACRKR